jgi:hypothetical protein
LNSIRAHADIDTSHHLSYAPPLFRLSTESPSFPAPNDVSSDPLIGRRFVSMRSLFWQLGGGLLLWAVLLPMRTVLAGDELPAPLTLAGNSDTAMPVPKLTDVKQYRLRTIEPDDSATARGGVQSLFSVFDPLFRSGTNLVEIAPLVGRENVDIVPVSLFNLPTLPNPLRLLGNPAQWGGRFRVAYGTNFNDGSLLYGNLIIDHGMPLGIDTEANYRTDPKRILADRNFWNGDFNVVYHVKQIRYVGFRLGIGANWLTDGDRTDVGFNTTAGFDIRLTKPWYVSTVVDWGWLGSQQMLHWQISGGLDFGRFELFIGYDFFEIGNVERKNALVGAGIWF